MSKQASSHLPKWIPKPKILKRKRRSQVLHPSVMFFYSLVDDGRINIKINSKTDGLKRFLPSEEDVAPEKLKLDPAFFPDRDETNFRNPPAMNIVIQIIGSRGNHLPKKKVLVNFKVMFNLSLH
jgi:hypothetical protein